uniref:C2H2-type domain-containing protein n=1 Tax=Glossina morsitans morsitans TaxID=37546 RepID=A0A1B0G9W4_GLOMM
MNDGKQLFKRRIDFLDEETKEKHHISSNERKNVNDGALNKHTRSQRKNSLQDKEFLTTLPDNNAGCETQNRPQGKQMYTVQSVNYAGDSESDITFKKIGLELLKVFDNLNQDRQLEKNLKLAFRNVKALNQDELVDCKRMQQGRINGASVQSDEKRLRNTDIMSQIALQQMLCDNQRVPPMQNLNEHYQRPYQSLPPGIANQHTTGSIVFSTPTCISSTRCAADKNVVPDYLVRRNMNNSQTSTHFDDLQPHLSESSVARQTNTNFSLTTNIPQRHCVAVQRKMSKSKSAVESNQPWEKPKDYKSLEISKSYSKEKEANSRIQAKGLRARKENASTTTASKYNAKIDKLYKELECTVKGFDQVSDYIPKYKSGKRASTINAMNNISEQLNDSDSSDDSATTKFHRIKRKRSSDTNAINNVFNLSKKGTLSIKEFDQKYKHLFENQPIVKLHRLKEQQTVKYVKCCEEAPNHIVGIKLNNDREMTEMNTRYCVLCYSKPHNTVAHYVRRHKTESYVSRLTEAQLHDLTINTNFAEPQRSDHKGTMYYKVICYFCKDVLIEPFIKLYNHYSQHTGEYAYVCSYCLYCKPFRTDIESHQHRKKACRQAKIQVKYRYQSSGACIYLYFCSICNYVQLNKANVSKHLRRVHSPSEAIDDNVKNCVLVKIRRLSTDSQMCETTLPLPVNEIEKNGVQNDSTSVPKFAAHSRSQSLNINSVESSREISEDVLQHEWLVPRGADWMKNYTLCFSDRNFVIKCLYSGCDFLATKYKVLFKHLQDQHEIKGNSFICSRCPFEHARCQSWESIFDHLKIHLDSYVYICCVCSFHHSSRTLFTTHIRQEHDAQDVPYVQISTDCEPTYAELGFVFATGMYFFSTIYNCFCCEKQDMEKAGLVLHLTMYHKIRLTYHCEFCCKVLHDPKSSEDHFEESHSFGKPKIYCKLAAQSNLTITSIQPLKVNLWKRELKSDHEDYNTIVF